jgi:hypothetical protein
MLALLALLMMGLVAPWPVFMVLALMYAFIYEGVELVVLGFMLDAYFGYSGAWLPMHAAYSIALTGMLLFVWGLKPLIQTERNDLLA